MNQLNLNKTVKVRLGAKAKQHLKESHQKLYSLFPEADRPKFKLPPEDADGFTSWQLWELMGKFGELMQTPGRSPFDSDIYYD